MKAKKILSLLLALVLIASAAAIAIAEDATTADEETAEAVTEETEAVEETYTMDEMMSMAMADAYARQAAYAAYAEAFPDSKSITGIDLDAEIVLLEMLLKANDVALPASETDVTVPETKTEAYQAIATAESDALAMYKSFLAQESLAADAKIVFSSVAQSVRSDASTFARKAQTALREAQWQEQMQEMQELMNSDQTQVYTMNNRNGRGTWTVYVYNSNSTDEATDETDEATVMTDETDEATDDAVEESVSD